MADQEKLVQWELDEEIDVYLVNEELSLTNLRDKLAGNASIQGSTYIADYSQEIIRIHASISRDFKSIFDGLRLETCANKASVISRQQYISYCDENGLMPNISKAVNRFVYGIGGRLKALGTVKLQITFDKLHLMIDE